MADRPGECLSDEELATLARGGEASHTTSRSHVDSCTSCSRKLAGLLATQHTAQPDPGLAVTKASGATGSVRAMSPGATIGRHVITRALGAGAMGVVYEAQDPELGRTVAIKLLRGDRYAGDDAMVARLKREARALAQLAHPNVVAIHDVGVHEGAPFLAMEHVQGVTLRAWIDAGRRSWRDVARVFEQAAHGLAAAHATGLVHRDFKPDNVMIGNDGRVRVMDFGLARAADAAELGEALPSGQLDVQMTASGAFVGTPAYMAPEQFAGGAADARTDQFNFMIALYEALFGKRPYSARTLAELALAVTEGEPAPPPAIVPRELRELVMRGLAREPAARHRDMSTVAAALARLQSGRPRGWLVAGGAALAISGVAIVVVMRADKPSACELGARRIERHWDGSVRARIARHFAGLGGAGAAHAEQAAKALDDYVRRWRVLSRETCEARGSLADTLVEQRQLCLDTRLRGVEALVGLWAESTDPAVAAAAPSAVFALPPIAECTSEAATVHKALSREQSSAIDRLRSRIAGGRARLTSGLTDQGLGELRAVADEAAKLDIPSFAAEAELALATAQLSVGLVLDARDVLERARARAEQAGDTLAVAEALVRSIGAANAAGDLDGGLAIAQAAERALGAAGQPDRLQLLFHRYRGHLYLMKGSLDLAARDLDAGHARTVELFGADSVEAAESERMLGALAFGRKDRDGARRHWQQALELVERLHGDRHPAIAHLRTHLCNLDVDDAPEVARRQCDAARAYYEAAGGAHRGGLARALWIGAKLEPTPEQELATLERARNLLRETAGAGSLDVASITAEIATIHFAQRRYVRSAEEIAEQISTLERALGAAHPRIPERLAALGRAWLLADKLEPARAAFERSLQLYDKLPDPDVNELITNLIELGNLRGMMGDMPAGMALLERAVALASEGGHADPKGERRGTALMMVGSQLSAQDNNEAAISYFDRALTVKNPQTHVYALAGRMTSYAMLGRRREAERDLARLRKLVRERPADKPLVEATACNAYLQLGDFKRALRICVAVTALYPAGGVLHAMLSANVAECQLELGDVATARAALEQIASRSMADLGAPAHVRGELMFQLARARRAAGDKDAAIAAADEAERELLALGLEGRRTLGKLREWRSK